MSTNDRLLHLYLRDHFAGATGGLELAKRIAGSHRQDSTGPQLAQFARDVADDRDSLAQIMTAVGAHPDPVKSVLAIAGERLGRFKLNGGVVRRSPLSNVVELEMMRMGVEGKSSAFRALRAIADQDDRLDAAQLDRLVERAEGQTAMLETLRIQAATEAFTS
jgi:hypothetical protein